VCVCVLHDRSVCVEFETETALLARGLYACVCSF
jgi:hypothetical protein